MRKAVESGRECSRKGAASDRKGRLSERLNEGQSLVVATALKVMRELRIDWSRKARLQFRDPFGGGFQPFKVRRRVALIRFTIGNHGESFSQRGGELLKDGGRRHDEQSVQ